MNPVCMLAVLAALMACAASLPMSPFLNREVARFPSALGASHFDRATSPLFQNAHLYNMAHFASVPAARAPVYLQPRAVSRNYGFCNPAPQQMQCSYSVDDDSNLYDCSSGSAVSSATLGEIAMYNVSSGDNCSDFLFDIHNVAYDGGMSMACKVGSGGEDSTEQIYTMWGQGAPRTTETNYYQWQVYASWESNCYRYEERPGPQVVYNPRMLNGNDAMKKMAVDFDAYPFSAAGGNPYGHKTLCDLVENLVCQ